MPWARAFLRSPIKTAAALWGVCIAFMGRFRRMEALRGPKPFRLGLMKVGQWASLLKQSFPNLTRLIFKPYPDFKAFESITRKRCGGDHRAGADRRNLRPRTSGSTRRNPLPLSDAAPSRYSTAFAPKSSSRAPPKIPLRGLLGKQNRFA